MLSRRVIGLFVFDTVAAKYFRAVSVSVSGSRRGPVIGILWDVGLAGLFRNRTADLETRGKLRASTSSLALYFQATAMRFYQSTCDRKTETQTAVARMNRRISLLER